MGNFKGFLAVSLSWFSWRNQLGHYASTEGVGVYQNKIYPRRTWRSDCCRFELWMSKLIEFETASVLHLTTAFLAVSIHAAQQHEEQFIWSWSHETFHGLTCFCVRFCRKPSLQQIFHKFDCCFLIDWFTQELWNQCFRFVLRFTYVCKACSLQVFIKEMFLVPFLMTNCCSRNHLLCCPCTILSVLCSVSLNMFAHHFQP